MGKYIGEINGIDIFEYEYEKYRYANEISTLEREGATYRLYNFLLGLGYETTIEEVAENVSAIRDGNRLDLMDDYKFHNSLEISFLYINKNGFVSAVLYDKANDDWYGEFEIKTV